MPNTTIKSYHRTKIDYIRDSEEITGRAGYVLNIITGCRHRCPYCYARTMVLNGRLQGHRSYPYGFEPTYHPDRVGPIGGKKKFLFLNDMGDVGGEWAWRIFGSSLTVEPEDIADAMREFAGENPKHICLLLTKNPAWFRYGPWPDNVYCGFTATNNRELQERLTEILKHVPADKVWMSLEPWQDDEAPMIPTPVAWITIGGLSGINPTPVSPATMEWLENNRVEIPRFVKANSGWDGIRKEYPDTW